MNYFSTPQQHEQLKLIQSQLDKYSKIFGKHIDATHKAAFSHLPIFSRNIASDEDPCFYLQEYFCLPDSISDAVMLPIVFGQFEETYGRDLFVMVDRFSVHVMTAYHEYRSRAIQSFPVFDKYIENVRQYKSLVFLYTMYITALAARVLTHEDPIVKKSLDNLMKTHCYSYVIEFMKLDRRF